MKLENFILKKNKLFIFLLNSLWEGIVCAEFRRQASTTGTGQA